MGEKCKNGSYLECNVCSRWDDDGKNYGFVKMRRNYWIGYFNDHIKSARHGRNCSKKVYHDLANKRRADNGESQEKRLKHSTDISSGTSAPTNANDQDTTLGDVYPITTSSCSSATKEEEENTIMSFFEVDNLANEKKEVFCQGILAKKDLTDITVQGGIKYTLKYCDFEDTEKWGYNYGIVKGTTRIQSLFSNECTGTSETVKPRGKMKNNTQRYGLRCDHCQHFLSSSSASFLKNRRKAICDKYRLYSVVEAICDGSNVYGRSDDKIKKASKLLKTQDRYLSVEGKKIKKQLVTIKAIYKDVHADDSKGSTTVNPE